MASIYFAVTLNSPGKDALERAIASYGGDEVFRLADDKFFIATEDTSLEVSKKIGVRQGEAGSGLVLRVTTYNGRATPSLWEWLTARQEK